MLVLKKNNYIKSIPTSSKKVIPPQRKRSDFHIKNTISAELSVAYKRVVEKAIATMNESRIDITYFQYLLNSIYKSKKVQMQDFSIADNLLRSKFDILTYLEITKQFEIIKQLNLNYYQNYSLSFITNPNIKNQDDIDLAELIQFRNNLTNQSENTKLHEMIYYFKSKKESIVCPI